jgi:hypothetical protein
MQYEYGLSLVIGRATRPELEQEKLNHTLGVSSLDNKAAWFLGISQ